MAEWLTAQPQLRAPLAKVAGADPEPKLRAQAARALAGSVDSG